MPKRKAACRETSFKGCKRGCRTHGKEGNFQILITVIEGTEYFSFKNLYSLLSKI